jgi:hypothetical protein
MDQTIGGSTPLMEKRVYIFQNLSPPSLLHKVYRNYLRGYSHQDVKLTTDLNVVPRLRTSEATPPNPFYISSWHGHGKFTSTFFFQSGIFLSRSVTAVGYITARLKRSEMIRAVT